MDAHPEAGRFPARELLGTAWSGFFTQSLPQCAAFAGTILELRASSGCLEASGESGGGRWSPRSRGRGGGGPDTPRGGQRPHMRGCPPRKRERHSVARMRTQLGHFSVFLAQKTMAGASGDGKSRAGSPRAAFCEPRMRPFLILRSELTPSAPCGRACPRSPRLSIFFYESTQAQGQTYMSDIYAWCSPDRRDPQGGSDSPRPKRAFPSECPMKNPPLMTTVAALRSYSPRYRTGAGACPLHETVRFCSSFRRKPEPRIYTSGGETTKIGWRQWSARYYVASRLHPEKLLQAVLECRESLP